MLFETKTGPVRLRWNERGLSAIEMPELPPRELRELADSLWAEHSNEFDYSTVSGTQEKSKRHQDRSYCKN